MRLIDADAKITAILYDDEHEETCEQKMSVADYIDSYTNEGCPPAVDAAPVVRCKDCKHYREGEKLSPQKFCFRLRGRDGKAIGYNFAEDDFCSYGERSEE